MQSIKNVMGSEESAMPIVKGKDTIYVHSNIRTHEMENPDGTTSEVYVYDEMQFNEDEYNDYLLEASVTQNQEIENLRECILELSELLFEGGTV